MEPRQLVVGNCHFDRAGLAGNTADQTSPLELDDHLVDGGRGDLEEPLKIGLGRRPSVQQRVRRDERQVLTCFSVNRGAELLDTGALI